MIFKKCGRKLTETITVALLMVTFFLSGCAHNMALQKGQSEINLSGKSVALLSVKVSNENRPGFQLDIRNIRICPGPENCRELYEPESPNKSEEDKYTEYLLSFDLDSGTQNIIHMVASYHVPLLVFATATVPINLQAEIKPNSVVYLGHLDVILREKKNDSEKRAALFPLIDAAIVGFSSGTFDVVVEDAFDGDIKRFVSEYPALQNVKIEKSILPQWIRPENR